MTVRAITAELEAGQSAVPECLKVLASVRFAAAAGTHPVGGIDPGATGAARRRQLSLPRRRPS